MRWRRLWRLGRCLWPGRRRLRCISSWSPLLLARTVFSFALCGFTLAQDYQLLPDLPRWGVLGNTLLFGLLFWLQLPLLLWLQLPLLLRRLCRR